jgi:hypothetical protein
VRQNSVSWQGTVRTHIVILGHTVRRLHYHREL